jgi:PBP1b-binding outer membrane lipoprotein LpoB
MKKKSIILLSLLSVLTLNGCSAMMAMNGEKEPNLAVVNKGSSKAVVEGELNLPLHTEFLENGNIVSTYQYTIGNEPSVGKAIVYVLLDLGTCFLSEIVTMPIELGLDSKGQVRQIKIEYTKDGEILKIS